MLRRTDGGNSHSCGPNPILPPVFPFFPFFFLSLYIYISRSAFFLISFFAWPGPVSSMILLARVVSCPPHGLRCSLFARSRYHASRRACQPGHPSPPTYTSLLFLFFLYSLHFPIYHAPWTSLFLPLLI